MSDVSKLFDTLSSNQDSVETADGEVITANQSTYSFDEVDALTSAPKKEEKAPPTDKEAVEELEKDNENEGIEEKVEAESKETDENSKSEDSAPDYKKIAAKFGEDSLDIPAEALIPHKVDGKEVDVPLQELLNNYSGKVAWDKRFSELDKERKSYTQEKETVERYINEFGKLAGGEDKMAAMEYLAQFAGIDPIQFRRELRSQVLEKYGEYQQMSEIERKALDQEEELSYYNRLRESENQQKAEQQTVQELQNQLLEIQKAHELTDDELHGAYNELLELPRFKNGEEQITPKILETFVVQTRAWDHAENTIKEIAPDLLDKEGFLEDLTDIILSNPDLDDNDIADVVREFSGSKKKNAQQKASDKVREKVSLESQSQTDKEKRENYLSFEDLDI